MLFHLFIPSFSGEFLLFPFTVSGNVYSVVFLGIESNTDNFPNWDANKNQSLPLEDLLHQSVKKGEKAEQINTPSRFHSEKKRNKSDALMSGKAKPCTTLNQERALVSRPSEIECIKENEW